jgi:hypothetical protein
MKTQHHISMNKHDAVAPAKEVHEHDLTTDHGIKR